MEYARPRLAVDGYEYDLLSFVEYKLRIGFPDIPNPTIDYQINQGNIDFVTLGRFRYIVYNKKAQEYAPGANYGKKAS